MDPIAVALVAAAAVAHAAWNRLLHDVPDRAPPLAVAGLIAAMALLPAVVADPPVRVIPLIGFSALAQTAYALFLAAAYRRGGLSLTYPVGRGSAPLLVTLGGWLVLAQRPTVQTVAAAVALVAGLMLVAGAGQHPARRSAILFALLVGLSIAAYSLVDARAVRSSSPAAYLGVTLLLQGLLLATAIRPSRERLRRALRPGAAIAAGVVVAYLLVLFAFQRSGAGRVATLRETSVLIALVLARERAGLRVWLGAAAVVAGAVLAAV